MGPEEGDSFKVEPGRVWMVPACADQVEEIKAMQWPTKVTEFTFGDEGLDWGEDWGSEEGLDGGLQGWPDGARAYEAWGKGSMTVEVSPEESLRWAAALSGRTLKEYIDLLAWISQARWLDRLTGENWSRLE